MEKRGLGHRMKRLALSLLVGGSMFQLGSCDPTVRNTILVGLEQTTATLLNTVNAAFFISLQDDEETTDNNTTLTTT